MLSRVAESIFWMSRYVERAESVARFLSVNINLSLDLPSETVEQWLPLVITTGDQGLFAANYDGPSKENVIRFLMFDRNNPNSVLSALTAARENARGVREIISAEMWEHVNRFYLMVRDAEALNVSPEQESDLCEQIGLAGQQFRGVTDATLTHGEPWHFCRLARALEVADKTLRILDVKYFLLLPSIKDVGTPYDDLQWSALLRSASAFEMYRQQHGRIEPAKIVAFLILDRDFPRAVLYCLSEARRSLHAISGSAIDGFSNRPEQYLGQLRAELAYMHAEDIVALGLHEFIDDLQTRLNDVGDSIHETFFASSRLSTPIVTNARFCE